MRALRQRRCWPGGRATTRGRRSCARRLRALAPGRNGAWIRHRAALLGLVAEDEGRYDEAEALQEEALTRFRAEGRPDWVGNALNALGVIAYERGEMARAAERFAEALGQYRRVDYAYGMGWALINLAKVARAQGDYAHAAALYRESLALRWAQGEKPHIAGCLRGLASVAAAARQYARAARLYGAAEAAREAIGAPAPRHHARSEQADRQQSVQVWASQRSPPSGRRGGRCHWRRRSPRRWR